MRDPARIGHNVTGGHDRQAACCGLFSVWLAWLRKGAAGHRGPHLLAETPELNGEGSARERLLAVGVGESVDAETQDVGRSPEEL